MKRLLTYLLLTVCTLYAYGADHDSLTHRRPNTHVGYTLQASPGRLLVMDSWQRRWQRKKNSFFIAAEANLATLPSDSNDFARDYNYPLISIGAKLSINDVTMHRSADSIWGMAEEVDYDSRLGNIFTLYGTFTRPLYRNRRWMFDYMLGAGIGYGKHKYNRYNNIDNELTGSRFLIYFTAGLHATLRIAPDWGIMGGLDFYHHSNGALNRPNKGANIVGPVIGIRYMPYDKDVISSSNNSTTQQFNNSTVQQFNNSTVQQFNNSTVQHSSHLFATISAGIGGKTLNEDWQLTQFHTPPGSDRYRTGRFHFYAAYSLRTAIMWRYARRWATGIGTDLYYGTYASHIRDIESQQSNSSTSQQVNSSTPNISPWSAGLSVNHHAYYGNLSVRMAIGYYLARHMGSNAKEIEKPYYEHIGLFYSFPSLGGLTFGASVKAHLTKADLTELVVSYPIVMK